MKDEKKRGGSVSEKMNDRRKKPDRTILSGQKARQGYIVLNTTRRRVIFFGAFAAIAVLSLILLIVERVA